MGEQPAHHSASSGVQLLVPVLTKRSREYAAANRTMLFPICIWQVEVFACYTACCHESRRPMLLIV